MVLHVGLAVLCQDVADGVLELVMVVDHWLLCRILVVKHSLLAVLMLAHELRLAHVHLLPLLYHLRQGLLVLRVVGQQLRLND